MAVRLTKAAVITLDRRFDQARTALVITARDKEFAEARVRSPGGYGCRRGCRRLRCTAKMAPNRVAHQCAELLVGHCLNLLHRVDRIHDADNGRINWRQFPSERFARRAAFKDCNHQLATSSANRVDCKKG